MATPPLKLSPEQRRRFAHLRDRINPEPFARSHLLITGATGFIPGFICDFLQWLDQDMGLGLTLHLAVRSEPRTRTRFPWLKDSRHRIVTVDWSNPAPKVFPKADYVLHAASPATPAACAANPGNLTDCNVRGTRAILSRQTPGRLRGAVYFSTSEVYGQQPPENTSPAETALCRISPTTPRALYPLAKLSGEALTAHYAKEHKLPCCSARIFHTYGPGMDLENDGRSFADLVHNVVRREPLQLATKGSAKRAFCHVEDTAAALLTLLQLGTPGQAYNVGNPMAVLSIAQLATLLSRLFPERSPEVILGDADPAQSQASVVLPNTRALEALGWFPLISASTGFRQTVNAYIA
jgi:UDP-glucuronate decarboxylase